MLEAIHLFIFHGKIKFRTFSNKTTPGSAKGKNHKKYECGAKASLVVTTMKSNIIIGVAAHEKNEHDSKTLEAALSHANKHRTKPIVYPTPKVKTNFKFS